jgi:chromosome segregation ATPase
VSAETDLPINDAVPAPTKIEPGNLFLWNWRQMQVYAQACVAHATAPLLAEIEALREQLRLSTVDQVNAEAEANDARAEIEALRAEMKVWKASFEQAAAGHATYAERAEQLAEAIRAYKSECDNPAKDYVLRAKRRDEMFALLRDQEEGK